MIRVNLLPIKATKRQETVKSEMVLGAGGAVLLVAMLTLVYLYQVSAVSTLEDENRELQLDIDRLNVIVGDVKQLEKLRDDVKRKLDVIRNLKKLRTGPVRMLDELAQATPEKLQVTSLDETAGLVKLNGIAVSHEDIATFMTDLEDSPYFANAFLNSIEAAEVDGAKLKEFVITAQAVLPDDPAAAAPAAPDSTTPPPVKAP